VLQDAGLALVVVGGLVTIIVLAAMPDMHASSDFVWSNFTENNITGWSNGVAFLTGVLNGAFTIGTVDAITHMAEEMPDPQRDLPKGIFAQVGLGFLSKSIPTMTHYALRLTSPLSSPLVQPAFGPC
jgi:amino acid transporter